ncbi:uncharacterized protein LOC109415102 [Aedes albopictus]|uniref:SAM-dependent MTase RsmB/NOP-type domain-containing protein n=1 Tax=Aedes albopictus TaxID=7160 RepID=A0ABM1Y954_AEDAL|nr:25S rRNA (cytosine-C(5))-methyltransferase nop2-like [Aedes albopictus]KXJ69146.1 hypothetical protein RP20_CCG028554 [Aedes albopictus]
MGRKVNFAEVPKKGPGRKSRKQKDPTFDKKIFKDGEDVEESKKLSHRQKIRAKKRQQQKLKNQELKAKNKERKAKAAETERKVALEYNSDDESEEENKVQNQLPVRMDVQKSKAKYAKVTSKAIQQALPNKSKNEEIESDDNGSSDDDGSYEGTENKRGRDILASDEDSDESEERRTKIGKLKDFMDSDEDDSDEDAADSDEDEVAMEDDEELGSMLPIEKAGKKLKKKLAEDKRLADAEMQDLVANKEKFQFPEDEQNVPSNLQDIHMRIKEVIGVLADFSVNRDPNRSRSEYMELLCKDLCIYYSYNEFFMQLLMKLFSPNELLEFLEASEVQRPLTIRTNSLKTRRRDLAQALINRGVNLDPIGKWSKEGLVVYTSQVPLGATPEYLAGHYMIQGASSMLPVIALGPEENERILDMCAAPGGKSSHIAALMKNTGVLFANDVNKDRLQAVVGNFHRLGIQNAIVTSIDGTKYQNVMTGFDRVLLDAPCTGSGVISKDPSVKTTKTEVDIQRCYNLQRKLLLTAIDCLSANSETGGYLVYSTCSILPQENEWVVNYALRKRNVRLVPTGLDFGNEGFVNFAGQKYHPSMKLTRRFYPHTYNMDGFFVAKLQKFSDAIPSSKKEDTDEEEVGEENQEPEETDLPKKIDKRDWFYKDVIEKRKKQREDPHHVVKVFEKPSKNKKQDKLPVSNGTPAKPTVTIKPEEVSKTPNIKSAKNKKQVKTPVDDSTSATPVTKKATATPKQIDAPKMSNKKMEPSEKKLKKRKSLPESTDLPGTHDDADAQRTPKSKKLNKRLSLPGSYIRSNKK